MHNFCGACISGWCDILLHPSECTSQSMVKRHVPCRIKQPRGKTCPQCRDPVEVHPHSLCTQCFGSTRAEMCRACRTDSHTYSAQCFGDPPPQRLRAHDCACRRWLGTISSARSSTRTFGVNLICSAGAPIERTPWPVCASAAGRILSTAGPACSESDRTDMDKHDVFTDEQVAVRRLLTAFRSVALPRIHVSAS